MTIACSKLRKKICEETDHCEWIINKGCRKSSPKHISPSPKHNSPSPKLKIINILTKKYITENTMNVYFKAHSLSPAGYKSLSQYLYLFCENMFSEKLDIYDKKTLVPPASTRKEKIYKSTYIKECNKYVSETSTSNKVDIKIGHTIEKIFNIEFKDDESILFLIGGLNFFVYDLIYASRQFKLNGLNNEPIRLINAKAIEQGYINLF